MGIVTDPTDLDKMRLACQGAARVLDYLTPFVKPGVTTGELDRLALDYVTNTLQAKSATVGYAPPGYPPFPGAICTSVNHQVCHGIPGDKVLKNGDVVNIDVTIIKDGWYGDTSRMYYVGEPSVLARRLTETTYECMWLGIQQVRGGATLGDIGNAIQKYAEGKGYSVVREFCGHGVGRRFHEDPQVLHYGKPGSGVKLVPGMIFTIEPMINAGRREIRQLSDGWTVVTRDHSLSAQWEHTVLVTENGYEVLTVSPEMPAPPAFITDAVVAPAAQQL
ncbi:type I methionyl aminopeptidase [Bordetella sp. LUAb4]|uniref:type I methionyl aminopeptidase n=1 Tax=Bordetella sp. LUAb4 TaxID=2843195 RepID=UPI001E64F533|nr:type I methionyl aminopeptidase [Bordetella sp. LUAb4]